MTTITDKKQYPGEQYLNELITNIESAARAPVEVVRAMAAELQKRREADSAEPVAYIFKHPAGKLFWALTDESNKDQSDVIPVYAAPPVPVVPAALPENDDEDGHDIDCLEPSEVYALGRTAGWNACRAAMLQGADGNSPAIPDAYDIEAFGVFSATEGENGLMLQIERFRFGTGKCPQIGKENMVPKFALQAIINRLQEHCDSMGNEALVDILSTPAAPQQEVK